MSPADEQCPTSSDPAPDNVVELRPESPPPEFGVDRPPTPEELTGAVKALLVTLARMEEGQRLMTQAMIGMDSRLTKLEREMNRVWSLIPNLPKLTGR